MSERIYNVRLTEEVREICLDSSEDWVQLPSSLQKAIESARPEHPERQRLLEQLWAAIKPALAIEKSDYGDFLRVVFATDSEETHFLSTVDKLRSLEAK